MDKLLVNSVVVFAWWTLTSFMCHYCAKLFLRDSTDLFAGTLEKVILLTLMQTAFFQVMRPDPETYDAKASKENVIILIAHACATWATNYSMAVTHAASTFAIKLTEPLTGALAQKLFIGVNLTKKQWLSIPVTVYGAIAFAEDSRHDEVKISFGTYLAFLSNVCLALRNVYIKRKHQSNNDITVNKNPYFFGVTLCFIIGLLVWLHLRMVEMTVSSTIYLFVLVIGSSIFHLLYSYTSTVTVLKRFSVVSHAYVNIIKRLFVIFLLYLSGSRRASAWNYIGLLICTAGLNVYIWSKLQHSMSFLKPYTKYKGIGTKAGFTFVFAVVIALVFFSRRMNDDISQTTRAKDYLISNNVNDSNSINIFKQVSYEINTVFTRGLVRHPEEANQNSVFMTRIPDVIKEAQRIHMNIFQSEIGRYKYAMFFYSDTSGSKGDQIEPVGEMILLKKLNVEVILVCNAGSCNNKTYSTAGTLSKKYTNKELVILFKGGEDILESCKADEIRFLEIERLSNFSIVMFPQSFALTEERTHKGYCKNLYETNYKLTIVWRDMKSFMLGRELFPNARSLLAPDMAYQIGVVQPYVVPTKDIIWLSRIDTNSKNSVEAETLGIFRIFASDWLKWKIPGSSTEQIFVSTTNTLALMQRGRVVITNRLHGHIFSVLLGIPHVFIDDCNCKILNYHNTWTAGIDKIMKANSSTDALIKANYLLTKFAKEF